MKTARELAEGLRKLGCLCSPRARTHSEACDEGVSALTAAIEARDRELMEACAKAIAGLPVVGIATAPYLAALAAAENAVRALIPKEAP